MPAAWTRSKKERSAGLGDLPKFGDLMADCMCHKRRVAGSCAKILFGSGLPIRDDGDKIAVEKDPAFGMMVRLPNDHQRSKPPADQSRSRQGKDSSFVDAGHDFCRVLLPNGEIVGQQAYFDRSEQLQIIEVEAPRRQVQSYLEHDV